MTSKKAELDRQTKLDKYLANASNLLGTELPTRTV